MSISARGRAFAGRVVLPWALHGRSVGTDVLELGRGSGAMAAELLRRESSIGLTVADVDPAMVAAANRRLAPLGDRARFVVPDATDLSFRDPGCTRSRSLRSATGVRAPCFHSVWKLHGCSSSRSSNPEPRW